MDEVDTKGKVPKIIIWASRLIFWIKLSLSQKINLLMIETLCYKLMTSQYKNVKLFIN